MNTDHPSQILNLQPRKIMTTLVGLATTVSLEPRTVIATAKEPRPLQPAAPQSAGTRGLALVLGGGCHRALAHVGVIKVMEANGIVPDLIVGASAGSMVGALYASGLRAAALEKAAAALSWEAIQKFDLSRFGFYSSDPLRAFINQAVGGRKIEELPIRFAALAADLHTGAPHLFERGAASRRQNRDRGQCIVSARRSPIAQCRGRRHAGFHHCDSPAGAARTCACRCRSRTKTPATGRHEF